MEENKITFVKNYFDKEIILINDKTEFDEKNLAENSFIKDSTNLTENLNLKLGDYVLVNNQKSIVHIVRPGETLQSIALKYSVAEEDIKKLNKLEKIFIGQQLFI